MSLVLSRKQDERVIITHQGEQLAVTVYRIDHARVRLAFDAPRSFKVLRAEVPDNESNTVQTDVA